MQRPRITRGISRKHPASRRRPARDPLSHGAEAANVTNATNVALERMLTSPETAQVLRVSESWLAKARQRGDGPPYAQMGRAVRYPETRLFQWIKTRLRGRGRAT